MVSNSLFPFIIQLTRITTHSKIVIDYIFLNLYSSEITSGNLTASIYDHRAQFIMSHSKTQTHLNLLLGDALKTFIKLNLSKIFQMLNAMTI